MFASARFRRHLLLVLFIVMLCFCADTSYTIFFMHLDDLAPNQLVNVVSDLMGSYVCVTLFATVVMDKRNTDESYHFLLMIFLELILLSADAANWILEGNPEKETYLMIANIELFTIIILMAYAVWKVVQNDLNISSDKLRIFDAIIKVFAIIGLINALLTPFTDWAFFIENGSYYRGSHNFLSNCPVNIMVITLTLCVILYGKSVRRKATILIYMLIPMIAMIFQIMFYGYSFLYISLIITLLIIYGNYYVSRGTYILEIRNELTESRFATMYSQIQPHFLYNSLTSIMNIKGNPPETQDAIADFGKYLRGNIDSINARSAIPLSRELAHVEYYVNLEKLRFKERLNVVYDIQDSGAFVPPLTLQVMVENAIKHGITMKEEGGTVTISTYADEKYHYIVVKDDGVGFDVQAVDKDNDNSGIFILRNRLSVMVNGTLTVESEIGKGTTAIISIPRH